MQGRDCGILRNAIIATENKRHLIRLKKELRNAKKLLAELPYQR